MKLRLTIALLALALGAGAAPAPAIAHVAPTRFCGDAPRLFAYDIRMQHLPACWYARSWVRLWNRTGKAGDRCRYRETGWEEAVVKCWTWDRGHRYLVRWVTSS